jgi:hypothetical protein
LHRDIKEVGIGLVVSHLCLMFLKKENKITVLRKDNTLEGRIDTKIQITKNLQKKTISTKIGMRKISMAIVAKNMIPTQVILRLVKVK